MCDDWNSIWYIYIPLAQAKNDEIIWGMGEMVERRVMKSAPSPCAGTYSMTEQDPKAYKISGYGEARVPRPSRKLYESMALKAWHDYKERMEMHVGHEMPEWDELADQLKEVWISVARGQHGVIAVYGGGKIERIDAKKTSDDM
jgi:hypothetical protein